MTNRIEWDRQFKVALRESTEAQTLHWVVKALLVQRLALKNSNNRYWIKVYTEHPVCDGKIADVYFENVKTKECYAYEIQKVVTPKWIRETNKTYEKWEVFNMRTGWVLIDLNHCPKTIDEIKKWLDEQIL